jgi:hypothetical protein
MEAARLMRSVPTGGVSDPQRVGVPDPSTEIPVPETPEEQQSLLGQLGGLGLSAFGAVGNFLDLPGSMLRDALAFENPFDQLLSPFSHENRVTGRDLLTQYGIAEANKETGISGWFDDPMEGVRDVGGFLAEVALDPLNMLFAPVKAASTAAKTGTAAAKAGTAGAKVGAKVATEAGEAAAKAAAPAGRGLFQNIVDPLRFSEMGQQLGGKILGESAEGIAKATDEGVSLMARATGRGISKAAQKTGRLVERTGEALARSRSDGLKRVGEFTKSLPAKTKLRAVEAGVKSKAILKQMFSKAAGNAKYPEIQKQLAKAYLETHDMDFADSVLLEQFRTAEVNAYRKKILDEGGEFSFDDEVSFLSQRAEDLKDALQGKPGALDTFEEESRLVIQGMKDTHAANLQSLVELGYDISELSDSLAEFNFRYLNDMQKYARMKETISSSQEGGSRLARAGVREELVRDSFDTDLNRITSDERVMELVHGIKDGEDAAINTIRSVHEGDIDRMPARGIDVFTNEVTGAKSLMDQEAAAQLTASTSYAQRESDLVGNISKDMGELRDAAGGKSSINTESGPVMTPYGLRKQMIADRMRQLAGGNVSQHAKRMTEDGKFFLKETGDKEAWSWAQIQKWLKDNNQTLEWLDSGSDMLFESGDIVRYLPDTGADEVVGVFRGFNDNGEALFQRGITDFGGDASPVPVDLGSLTLLNKKQAFVSQGKVTDVFIHDDRFDKMVDYLIDHPEGLEGGGIFGNNAFADLEKGFRNTNWVIANAKVIKEMFIKGGKTILESGDVFGQADLVDEVGRVLLSPRSLQAPDGITAGIPLGQALERIFGSVMNMEDLKRSIAEANPHLLSSDLLANVDSAEQALVDLAKEVDWRAMLKNRETLRAEMAVDGHFSRKHLKTLEIKELHKIAATFGVKNYKNTKKTQLITAIMKKKDPNPFVQKLLELGDDVTPDGIEKMVASVLRGKADQYLVGGEIYELTPLLDEEVETLRGLVGSFGGLDSKKLRGERIAHEDLAQFGMLGLYRQDGVHDIETVARELASAGYWYPSNLDDPTGLGGEFLELLKQDAPSTRGAEVLAANEQIARQNEEIIQAGIPIHELFGFPASQAEADSLHKAYIEVAEVLKMKKRGRTFNEKVDHIIEALQDPGPKLKEVAESEEFISREVAAGRDLDKAKKKLQDSVDQFKVNPELFNDLDEVLQGAKFAGSDFFPGGAQGTAANVFRSFTSMFKAGVLTWPARYTRDIVGGQINNMLNGLFSYESSKNAWGVMHNKPLENLFKNPNEYIALRRYLESKGIDPLEATGQQITSSIQELYGATRGHSSTRMRDIDYVGQEVVQERALRDFLDRRAGIGGEGLRGDLSAIKDAFKSGTNLPFDIAGVYSKAIGGPRAVTEFKPAKAADLVNKMTDDFNRMSGFMEALRKGDDAMDAMAKVNRVQVNYNPSTFTPTEQALKRIFPFYSFMSRQGAYVTNELLTNPTGRLGNFIRAVRTSEGEDERTLPSHVKAQFAIDITDIPVIGGGGEGSSQYLTGFGLMFEDTLNLLPTGGASDFLRNIVSKTNPLLKAPVEYAFGRSSFQGGPLGGRDLDSMDPTLGRIFTQLGIQDPLPNKQAAPAFGSRGLEFALSNSPVSRLLSTVKGGLDDRKTLVQRASNALLGMRLTTVDPQQRRRGAREVINARIKELGVRPFVTYRPSKDYVESLPEGEEKQALKVANAIIKSFERERRKEKAEQDGR